MRSEKDLREISIASNNHTITPAIGSSVTAQTGVTCPYRGRSINPSVIQPSVKLEGGSGNISRNIAGVNQAVVRHGNHIQSLGSAINDSGIGVESSDECAGISIENIDSVAASRAADQEQVS